MKTMFGVYYCLLHMKNINLINLIRGLLFTPAISVTPRSLMLFYHAVSAHRPMQNTDVTICISCKLFFQMHHDYDVYPDAQDTDPYKYFWCKCGLPTSYSKHAFNYSQPRC